MSASKYTSEQVKDIYRTTEERVANYARSQRLHIIQELYSSEDAERLDKVFYPNLIQPLIYSYLFDNVEQYRDFMHLPQVALDNLYLRLNGSLSRQVFSSLRALDAPLDIEVLTEDVSNSLERLMSIYEDSGRDWEKEARIWSERLTDEDLDIWELALRDEDPITIKEQLKLIEDPAEIIQRIQFLQRDLLLAFLRGLSK
ncbi:MAG TPA: hypothetical protein VGE45_13900 [Chloroflexia bacterium]